MTNIPDPQKWTALFESYFGPRLGRAAVTSLLALICIASALFLLSLIWGYGGEAVYKFFAGLVDPDITLDNLEASLATLVWFVVLFGIVVVAILFFLARALFKRAVSQTALDELAVLRNEGIDKIYANTPKTDQEYADWKLRHDEWESRVLDHIKKNFPKADYLYVSHLGIVEGRGFPHSKYNDAHEVLLMFHAKRLEIIEAILASYRR